MTLGEKAYYDGTEKNVALSAPTAAFNGFEYMFHWEKERERGNLTPSDGDVSAIANKLKRGETLSASEAEMLDNIPKEVLYDYLKIQDGTPQAERFESIYAVNKDIINEKNFKKYLQTKNIPDPELLIRTGNTKRLSNFLLWQLAYAEIFFEKKLWPDFNEKDYVKIIKKFKMIKRNFGKI